MPGSSLRLVFETSDALTREYEANLRYGRAFVPGASGLALFDACTLRIERAETGAALELGARVVMIGDREPMRGIAVELTQKGWNEPLAAFVAPEPVVEAVATLEEDEQEAQAQTGAEAEAEAEAEPDEPQEPEDGNKALERQKYLRNLSITERMKMAHSPRMDDRVQLERIYGSAVWEALLRYPGITPPEVARIARKGTLPRPLVETIVNNGQWIRQDLVRRALLSNPRLTPEAITTVLRATPGPELKTIATTATYPHAVRNVARRLAGLA